MASLYRTYIHCQALQGGEVWISHGVWYNLDMKKSPRKRSRKPDPRVALFKSFYVDPKSETFGNARGSAIRAGYTEMYADNITAQMPKWLEELLHDDEMMRADMLKRAQRNIKEIVDEPKPEDKDNKKLWYKASEYVSGTLGRDFYSTRQELTGASGRRLFGVEDKKSQTVPLEALFKGVAPQKDK